MSGIPPSLEALCGKAVKRLQLAGQTVKGIRWMSAGIAFCLAVTLWYGVTVRDKVETWVDVGVQFKGAPANLVISEGLINKLAVRVRAARGLSHGLAGRDASVVMDISSIVKGSNVIAITRDMLPFTSAYEVVEISPARVQIVADAKATREIELDTHTEGKLAPDFFVESLRLEPQKVTISGAKSQVDDISHIRVPVPLAPGMPKGKNTLTAAVPVTAGISVAPPQVGMEIEIGVRVKRLKLVRDIAVAGYAGGHSPEIQPGKVTIVADIPESLTRSQTALAAITASVTPPGDLAAGESRKLPVSVKLPENAVLVSVTPGEVVVSVPADR